MSEYSTSRLGTPIAQTQQRARSAAPSPSTAGAFHRFPHLETPSRTSLSPTPTQTPLPQSPHTATANPTHQPPTPLPVQEVESTPHQTTSNSRLRIKADPSITSAFSPSTDPELYHLFVLQGKLQS
ncbi:hypothetical protein T439DRAFT_324931 [Meredithblackwellia eburnea MCA 4105]